MSSREIVSTPAAPQAIGPYSQAVKHGGLVYCSGQIALDAETGELIGGDVQAQTERCLRNLQAVLEASGSNLEQVLKCTVFVKSMDDFALVNEVYARFFTGDSPPARACVEVSRLPKDVLVEIDCVAAT